MTLQMKNRNGTVTQKTMQTKAMSMDHEMQQKAGYKKALTVKATNPETPTFRTLNDLSTLRANSYSNDSRSKDVI